MSEGDISVGLFSKKKPESPVQEIKKAAPAPAPQLADPAQAFDADIFFKSHEAKAVKGPRSIKESTIKQKLEEMEDELSKGPDVPDYHDYDKNPVREKELNRANDKLETICAEVRQKEERTRYKAIRSAVDKDMDKRLDELSEQYDYLADENYNRNRHDFSEARDDENLRAEQEKDMLEAERREKVKSTMPKLTDKQLEAIERFSNSDIKAKPIDLPDKIPQLSTDVLERLTRQFEEKYGSIKEATDSENAEKDDEPKMSEEDERELERLRSMFG